MIKYLLVCAALYGSMLIMVTALASVYHTPEDGIYCLPDPWYQIWTVGCEYDRDRDPFFTDGR
jgi:hypothetical protein